LFAVQPTVLKAAAELPVEDTEENKPYKDPKLSVAQIKEREARTAFVGNVNIQCKHSTIKKHFAKYGTVESVWFRSVPVNNESKVPIRGKVALKDFVDFNDAMNCYILFSSPAEAEAACEANNTEFLGKYLRVTVANQKEHDTKTTIFVGNLYFKAKEEELREHFKGCGAIHSVRIIRDPVTHMGKGFAYVRFADKQGYLAALKLNMSEFMNRELRIKRAVDVSEENKKKDIVRREAREKDQIVRPSKPRYDAQSVADTKEDQDKMRHFSKGRMMEDEMTEDRASEIYKTVGKIPHNMIRGQIKKIKKEGIKGADATQRVNWVKEKAQRRMGERIFYKRDEMKHRREVRKIKKIQNVAKSKAMKAKGSRRQDGQDIRLKRA
jgi:nucleolar protein 12